MSETTMEVITRVVWSLMRLGLGGFFSTLIAKGYAAPEHIDALYFGIGGIAVMAVVILLKSVKNVDLIKKALDLDPGSTISDLKIAVAGKASKSSRQFLFTLPLILIGVTGLMGVGCAKKDPNLPPAEDKARIASIYTAQAYSSAYGWHRMTGVLVDNNKISADAGKNAFVLNEQVVTALDIITDRVKTGLPADAKSRIEELLKDVDKAEAAGLLGIDSDAGKAKYREVMFSLRFTLNSIWAIYDASKDPTEDPTLSDFKGVAKRAIETRQEEGPWWTDAVLVVQETVIKMFQQSRFRSADQGWADGASLSTTIHAANKARIGG